MQATVVVKARKVREGAQLPIYGSEGACSLDLYACLDRPVSIGATPVKIPTGIALELPEDRFARIRDRSSLGAQGLHTLSGVIDPDYVGEVFVVAAWIGPESQYYTVNPGDRIAQLTIAPFDRVELVEAKELKESARGAKGFGSTGR